MEISVIHEDGTENEFEIVLCCKDCAAKDYGWSVAQFDRIISSTEPIHVPNSIKSVFDFQKFVKNL